jgi:multiple sugar transport system substrate-binding protein
MTAKWSKEKTSKILIICIMALFAFFLFRGCETVNNTAAVQTGSSVQKVPPPITLEFWGISSEDNKNEEILEQLVNKFNTQNNKIHVNLDMKNDGYFYKIYSAAMASQTNPDVGMMFCSQAAQFCDRGFLFALDNTVNSLKKRGKVFYPGVLEQVNLYKQYFGIPISIQNFVLLVRKDILNKARLNIPKNMAELLETLEKLSQKDQAGIALPSKGYLSTRTLLYFLLVNGGTLFDGTGDFQLSSTKNNEVYSFFNKIYKENLVYNKKSQLGINDVVNLFTRGDVAFILTTPTTLKDIYSETNKDFINNIDIISLKGFDNLFYSSGPVFNEVLTVFKNSQHKDEAQVFVEWLCENYSELWPEYQYDEIPAIIENQKTSILNERFTKRVFQELIPETKYPSYPVSSSVNYIVTEGTDVISSFIHDLSTSNEISGTVRKYQDIVNNWSERFNR